MKPGLDESLLSQFDVPIEGAVKAEEATRAMPMSDAGFRSLEGMLGGPMEIGTFLRIAVTIASALGRVHQDRLVHKDIKPANILVNSDSGEVRFTGFGLSSRVARERPQPRPPESIAGTLAYMAPEQTGRMNRSIDSRSDLYALGVTLYQMLTGFLPFNASDPMEWVHCHIARKPAAPSERLENVPAPVSAIIMKLLAKMAEERYQTASGAASDLRRCLAEWKTQHRIDEFPLGEQDTPDRLLIPEKLYGREPEIGTLLASFDRVLASGTPELVLVSGYSGVGKSSVVNELHKPLVPPRGLFASGKFDQYKRDIPYSTLAQAFKSLSSRLLVKSEAELATWRAALLEALGENGRLMIDLVPELKHIIGDQPPVPDLAPQDARRRFQLVFTRFIGVFARPEHPLALFLDDLQWLDAATLDLLEDLLMGPDVRHLMLIGAYRDNEVDSTHPLMRKLAAIRQAGAIVHEIVLAPLTCKDLGRLIAESLHCEPERATPLAQLVHEKTAGNPFFAIQFISALAEEALVTFDHVAARWSWDLNRICAKGYTDNVVDLMVGKLNRLPVETQKALQQLACLGNSADFAQLTMVYQDSKEEMHGDLWEAVRSGLVLHSEHAYRFLHDRVQEAAYSLIPEGERGAAHLRIGRLLVAHTPAEKREEAIFEIVNQLNHGSYLITSGEERERVAELNFIAGRRAKISTAYASALAYLAAGRALLTDGSWDHNHELIFAIEFHTAECELLTANMAAAEDRLSMLARRARSARDTAAVARLRLTLYTTLDRSDRGVEVCLEYLQRGGACWSSHPTSDEVRREYDRIWSQIGGRSIEELIDLPLMNDSDSLAALDVLTEMVTPALFTDENLVSLVICRMVNLSLEHGNSDGSCFAYVWLGIIAGPRFGNYMAGFQFGQLGYELVEKRGLKRFQARTYMCFGNIVMPWTKHIRTGRDLVRRAFDAAIKVGDLTFAAYSPVHLNTNLLAVGDPLVEAQRETENGLEFAQKSRFGLVIDIITAQLGLIRTLRGLTPKFGSFNDERFDERRFERHLSSEPVLALPECWYWIRKLQARFFAGDYASAIDASSNAQRLLWTSPSLFETAEYHFYGALSHAACCDFAFPERTRQHFDALATHHRQLEIWAENCPENFANRAALVGAEMARIEGRVVDAEQLYEQAIRSAHEHGFVQNEGLAYELAARCYAARGLEDIGHLYLRRARHCYARWGADGKVRQLDERYPRLREEEPAPDSRATIGEPVERLELATVLKVSQAISGEIVLEKLVDTVLRTAIEHAGAERGLLLLSRGSELLVRAEGETRESSVTVRLCELPVSPTELPESVVRYAARTHEAVILADASARDLYSTDEYICATGVRSVLCLPLMKQGSLVALLYLENRLAASVFTPSRIALLEVLASQAAISLENSGLYRKLQQREAEIRRLFDANIVGIMFWDVDGGIHDANDAFLRMVGYERADLVSGGLRWTDLTPPEWLERDLEYALQQVRLTGSVQPYEKEFFRKDGSRVPVLIGGAGFDEETTQGVAFVVDITERKCAEEALLQQKAYLDELFDLAPDAIVLTSINNPRNLRINQEFTRMFGYTAEEAVGRRLRDLIAPDDLQPSNLTESPALLAGKTVEREVIRQRKDGTRFHAHTTAKRISLSDNEDAAYIIYRDITERKRAEEELRRSGNYLAEAQKVSHTGSWAWSPVSNTILYWSEECYRILGYDPAQGLPSFESTCERIHPEDRPALAETIERAVREKADFQIEYRLVLPDGTRRNVRILSHPVLDASGELVEFVGTVMDVTEQKRAQQERRAHLWFLESMDRINRAMQRSNDVELMTSGVMQEALEIFACDRACLSYPCDPDTPTYQTVMEHTSPDYDGVLTLGQDRPTTPDWAEVQRRALHHPGAVVDPSLPPAAREQFRIASMLAIAVRPKGDRPYLFVVHSARSRPWTAAELRLFEETARRLGDALTSVLAHRNLLASQEDLQELSRDLQESKAKLEEAQCITHVGYWELDILTGRVNWSDETYRIYGMQPQERPMDLAAVEEKIQPEDWRRATEAAFTGGAFEAECRLFRPTGEMRVAHFQGDTKRDASGTPYQIFGTVQDITDRKRAEEERREHLWFLESMDRINRAMQRSNDVELMTSGVVQEALAIFGSDRAWLVYPCDPDSPTVRAVMEHTSPEYPGAFALGEEFPMDTQGAELLRRVLDSPGAATDLIIPPEMRARFRIQSAIAIAVRPRGDRPYLFGLHQCSHVRAWTAAERRLFGEIARRLEDALTSVLAHRNLLAREEELRQSKAYLAEAQKLSQTGSWAWSPDQDIRYWSEECYRVLSFDPQDGLPRFEQFFQRIHPDDQPGFRELTQTATREKSEWKADYRIVHPGGAVRDIHVVGHPVLSTSNHLVEFVGTVIDVTEPKRAEEERREHLWFLESMDRVNRAMQRTNDVEGMMSGVLEETVAIFGCDRARLVYPCDPDAAVTRVVMQHSRPEYPGAFALGEEVPMDRHAADFVRRVLDSRGAPTDLIIPPEMRERFRIQSAIAIAVRPKGDRPYLLGLHQCSHARVWTAAERRLFEEIARRLEDALASGLAHRNLVASQEELRASEERFRTFVDHATDAFYLYDDKHIVRDANRQACETTGYTREELIGMHVSQLAVDATPEKIESLWQQLLEHGTLTYNGVRRRKDASVFPVEIRARTFNRGGRIFAIAIAIDITERRQREQRLLAQFRVTQTLSEASSLEVAAPGILRAMCEALEWDLGAFWQVDPERGVLRCTAIWPSASAAQPNFAAATQAISFGPGMGLPGRVWSSGGPLWIRDVALDPELPRAKSAAKEGLHAAFAFPVMLKIGIVGVVELFSREVRDADRGLLQMMAAIGSQVAQFIERTRAKDALRDAREKLTQASRIATVAELSASIAHEINQPLQAIVANGHASLRWLDAAPPNIEKAIRTAERVVRDGNAAAEVVGRIRALFKHAAPEKVDLDINTLILEVRSLMADEVQGNAVSLETGLGEDVPTIKADAVQIQQVIVNLVRNAIEAMAATMERPKPLWIRSRREGDNVVVEVQDHGVGLADPEKIFEPFVTTKETGLGMGLAICRSIIEAHAGRIWAARNPERGVTFSFSLPVENSPTG